MHSKKPRILLIGAGAFGKKHLNTLLSLERAGMLSLTGVVVNTERSRKLIEKEYKVKAHRGFSEALLEGVDAVDIVTPVDTHFRLVSRCLPKAHVFVEKPLAADAKETSALKRLSAHSKHILMVGHIFRFHPIMEPLRGIISRIREKPLSIEASLVNPIALDNGRDPELEMLHPFDMIDFLFGSLPMKKHVEDKGRLHLVSLKYDNGMHALLRLGWAGKERQRSFRISYAHRQIVSDLDENTIVVHDRGKRLKNIDCSDKESPLEAELRAFVQRIVSGKGEYPDAAAGHRAVEIASLKGAKKDKDRKMRVAIIGAGIFGTNCAMELASSYDVTVFDKNSDILSEASYINQYRHHWGYHYPRSQETVVDIRQALGDFERRYGRSIIRKFPTYYSVAKRGSKVTPAEFLEFCDRNELPYTVEDPPEGFLNNDKIGLCVKTYEPIYDYRALKRTTAKLLKERRVRLRLGTEVSGARLNKDGSKIIRLKKGNRVSEESFDYVINVTYARYNDFCAWLGFRKKPIRIDLVEVLWVKLNIPKISLAVMDGKFTNIVPTGRDSIFTLVHIKNCVLRRFVPKNGLVPGNIFSSAARSRIKRILDGSIEWFPFVKDAKVIKVHHVLRGVNAYREHDDARLSDITEHGFGCFSILGGKIVNAVSIAREMKRRIAK